MKTIIEIFKDALGQDVIDVYQTDLVDLNITQAEKNLHNEMNSRCNDAVNDERYPVNKVPRGKQVL